MTPNLTTLRSGQLSRIHAILNDRTPAPPAEDEKLITWSGLPLLDDSRSPQALMEPNCDDFARKLASEAAERQPAGQQLRLLRLRILRPFWRRG